MTSRFLPMLAAGGFLAAASGCLVTHGSSHEETGVRVSHHTLNQVTVGSTTEEWLLATLGEPTSRSWVEGTNQEILRYEHHVDHEEAGTVFLIFAGGKDYSRTSVTYFELTEGVVTKFWTESA